MSDPRLEALLAEAAPPPLPAGLADRVVAAATALPQEQKAARARRASGRDRRGAWLRRPLLGGAIALGLAFSGAVAAAIRALPDRQRAAIILTYYEGVPNAEAAAILGLGVKAVESLLVRARQALVRSLAGKGLLETGGQA